jgi:N-acetylgalactosamine-N,N'-diacetylbacillosaminyl-diphospho-undecaprenol 4-alpha-N-acetylgalactosaminyltransferase
LEFDEVIMKKKLSILVNDLDSGGAERVISTLLGMLNSKYEITLFMMHDIIFYDIPKDIEVVVIEGSNIEDSGFIKLLKLPIMALRYRKLNKDSTLSLSFLSRSNYINSFAKLFGMKAKVIVSERAMPSLQYNGSLQGSINRFLIKTLYKRADVVFANSKGNSLDLSNNFKIDDVKVIYNIFNISRIVNLSKRYTILENSDRFNFITIGRLDEGKNHQLLIRAVKDVDANLYIIGDGVLKDELKDLIKELELEDRVFMLGKQKNPYKYISKADAFVFGSKREGFPNVLIEALACKLPVISTDCPSGPREILSPESDINIKLKDDIEKAEYGVLTPLDRADKMTEAMELIKNDKELRDSYIEKSLKRAMDFDKEKIIDDFIKVID